MGKEGGCSFLHQEKQERKLVWVWAPGDFHTGETPKGPEPSTIPFPSVCFQDVAGFLIRDARRLVRGFGLRDDTRGT